MELRVQIFKFHLKRVQISDIQQLKQEISLFKKQNELIKGELKLFRFYFLHIWKDRYRKDINQPENQDYRHSLIESTNNLYDQLKATGLVLEEFGTKTYYLAFSSDMSMHNGSNADASMHGGYYMQSGMQTQQVTGMGRSIDGYSDQTAPTNKVQ